MGCSSQVKPDDAISQRRIIYSEARYIEIRWWLLQFRVYVINMDNEFQKTKARYGPLPVLGLPVEVQCDGFKCMAFRDKEGKWVDLFSRKFLSRVLGVVRAC